MLKANLAEMTTRLLQIWMHNISFQMFTVPDVNPHAIGEVLASDVCGWELVVLVKIKESVFIDGSITRIFLSSQSLTCI